MIKIANGSGGWWFDDHRFYNLDKSPLDYESESAEELRRLLCARLFNLYRWAGEEGRFGPVSVGFHSLLVSHLAGRLAEARDLSAECVRLAKSYGAAHDLGERLGLGDIVSPILRKHTKIKVLSVAHQGAAEDLFTAWLPNLTFSADDAHRVDALVRDADHLAAAVERRYLFDDDSGDCEAPGVGMMLNEIGPIHVWPDVFQIKIHGDHEPVRIGRDGCTLEEAIRCAR